MRLRALWAFTTACALFAGAWAQTTLYSTSFENPPFFAGSGVAGIDGWENGSGSGVGHLVTNELFRSGSQSVKWDNISNTSFYSIRRSFVWSQTDPDRLVVSVHVWVDSGTQANRVYGLYLTGSDTGTLGSTILGITIGGDGTVRAGTTWGATYGSSGVIGQAAPGTYTNRWLLMELTICRTNGQATAKISGFSDGSELQTNLVATGTPRNLNLGSDYVTSTDRAGIGFFDDLTVAADSSGCSPFEGWDEQRDGGSDAGDLPETAQSTSGNPINAIRGTIDSANDVDIYAIYIADPSSFSATTVGGTSLDTALWLFDSNGKGVVFNEDNPDATTGSQSRIDNRTNCITQPGVYYLAVSLFGRRATGCEDGLIWQSTPYREVRCPDGAEATSRVNGWSGTTSSTGTYRIFLTGVAGATAGDPDDCPPPAPWDEQYHGQNDAGDLPASAQIVSLPNTTACQTPVNRIRGNLEADGVDMYVIAITDPTTFEATTTGGAGFDTQLWLFRCDGTGIAFNDDDPNGGTTSRINNTTNCLANLQPNTYLLAISRYNRDAVDANGQLLWANSPFNAIRCPDGPGANNSIAGWTGTTAAGGTYNITLSGAYFVASDGCASGCGGGTCEGDVNSDGVVDDADLLEVLFNFGCFGFCGPSDVNRDGTVDDADLLVVLFNFGCGA